MVDWKKRLKKLAEDLDEIVPDEQVDEWVRDARSYLSNPTRVGRDVGKWAYNAPLIGGTRSPRQVREQYNAVTRKAVDPAREVTFAAVQERFNPRETVETLRERREQYGGLGAAFRARENTLAKRVTESALDPINLIGFGTAGAGRVAGQSTARLALKQLAKGGLREIAAPAAGQVVGAEVGRRIGGDTGAQIGELAGLLGGAVGPNIAGPLRETAAARVAEKGGVGRMLAGEAGEGPITPGLGRMDATSGGGASMRRPWQMTKQEFRNWEFGVPEGGSSKTPKTVFDWRDDMEEAGFESLYDLARSGDTYRFHEVLGKGWPDLGPTSLRLADKARKNDLVTIYRAVDSDTDAGDIIPGAYVTESKWYAQNHGEAVLGGNFRLIDAQVRPSELLAYGDPHEFIYVPESLETGHRRLIQRALQRGDEVPDEVLAEYPEFAGYRTKKPPSAPATQRFYHGTGSAFDRPEAGRFDPNGLFGPGYYLTDDPRVAASYSDVRAEDTPDFGAVLDDLRGQRDLWQRTLRGEGAIPKSMIDEEGVRGTIRDIENQIAKVQERLPTISGPNIRPVDVPKDLRLFDVEEPLPASVLERITAKLSEPERRSFERLIGRRETPIGNDLYKDLSVVLANRGGDEVSSVRINRLLSEVGYDGIRYSGGQRIPLRDDAGNAIEHTAVVVFPESLNKIRNALSGTEGGTAALSGAIQAGSTAAGAYGGYQASEGEDWRTRVGATLLGGVAGYGLGRRVAQGKGIGLGIEDVSKPGRTADAFGMDPNRRYEFRYRVVSLDDLVPSHTDQMTPNPAFPTELQPRLRDRAASQLQIDQIAKKLEPDALLSDVRQIDRGPMIVGPDAVVESGNGRVLALRRARDQYPEQFGAYERQLRDRAAEYGLSADDLRDIKNPVLVRERLTDVDRVAFTQEANQAAVLGMSPFEQALGDAGRLSDDLLAGITVGENQTLDAALTAAANRPVAQAFIGALAPNERAGLIDASGNLNTAGLQRLRAALFARTYPGEAGQRLTAAFFESLDPTMKNVENALYASLPDVSRAEALIRSGDRATDLSISDDVSKAVDVMARLRQQEISVDDYLAQSSLFNRELDPFQESLLRYFDENRRTPTHIRSLLKGYAGAVEAQPHPQQAGMFGGVERATKGELLDASIRGQGPDTPESGIFGAAERRSQAAEAQPAAAPAERSQLAGTGERPVSVAPPAVAPRVRPIVGTGQPGVTPPIPGELPVGTGPANFADVVPAQHRPTPITGAAQPLAPPKQIGQISVPKDVVDPDPATRRGLREIAGAFFGLPRQLLLMGDLGQLGRVGIGGYLQSLSAGKPIAGAQAFGRAFRSAFDPKYFEELMSRPEMQRWADLAYPADMSNPEFSNLIARIPGIGHAERAMFNRFTPAYASLLSDAIFDGVKNQGDFARMPNDLARRAVIGDWIKGMLIGRQLDDAQVGTIARAVGRISLAPRWTAGGIVGMQKILDPGPQGELARRFWGTVTLTGAATSVGITAALTGKDPRDLINPNHPDSVLNPRVGRRFFGVELPDGTVISPMQPLTPLARAILRPFAEGFETYQEEQDIGAAIEAMVGEGWDSGRDYLTGKANIPIRMFNDIVIKGTDFQGRPIMTKEGPAGWMQAAGYFASQNAPIFTQPLLAPLTGRLNLPFDIERDARVPGTEPSLRDRALEFATGFVGITTRPPDRLPPDVASALRGAIEAKGGTPGADPDLISQYYGLKLDPSEKAALFREQPALREFFEARTKLEGEKYEKPAGKARVKEYQAKKARLDMARRQALTDLEAENLTGNEYRRRRSELFDRHRGMVMGLQEAIFDTSDPERIDAAMDAVYRTGGEQSEEQKALDGLYSIQQEGESAEARTAYFEARRAYTESLSPEMREKLFQRQLDDAPTETERSLIRAQREYQERYMSLPQYRGIKQEDADAARPYIAMAADIQRVRPGLPFRAAIRLTKAPLRVQQTAIKIKSGRFTDPRRRTVFARSPLLTRWYTEISGELLTQIAQPA